MGYEDQVVGCKEGRSGSVREWREKEKKKGSTRLTELFFSASVPF